MKKLLLFSLISALSLTTTLAQVVEITSDTTKLATKAGRFREAYQQGVRYAKGASGTTEITGTRVFRSLAELRRFTTPVEGIQYYLAEKGKEGYWYYDAADQLSADNMGTVVVTINGKRLKRSDTFRNLGFWGAKADNETNSVQAFSSVQDSPDFIEMKDGTYRVNGSVTLPQKFDGKKAFINATGVVRISNKTYQHITVNARHLVVSGTRLSTIYYTADTLDIDGYRDDYGCAWNRFVNVGSNKTLIRISTNKGYVNFNTFDGGRVKVELSGSTAYEAHSNLFLNADLTYGNGNGGFKQTNSNPQFNLMINGYAEANSIIQGQLGILGLNYDSDQPPLINARGFVLGATENIVRTAGDFLPIGRNLLAGDWSQLNAQGLPIDLKGLGNTPILQLDTTEISGLGRAAKLTSTGSFQGFELTLPAVYTHASRTLQSINLTLWYKGDDFQAGEAISPQGTVGFGVKPSQADTLTGWKLLRVIIPANRQGKTTARFYLSANKTTYVSTYYATSAKIAVLPTPAFSSVLVDGTLQVYDKKALVGQVVQSYTANVETSYSVNFSSSLKSPHVSISFQPYDHTYNGADIEVSRVNVQLDSQGRAIGFKFHAKSYSGDWAGRFIWKAAEY
ncbi:hypothetical protein [Siphonobacter curvatus]|uniref:Uncharacterized protein n=1 Tax=Siphonobacter curvatus TaxID=2094562 RepID=A0A2S7IQY6_9BACT|nr:hypothetical protein [Siphonobacter curvatus]PQA60133.1 hypothetical protein C5O19_11100 [Siphonobacter curvatus]